MQEHVQSTISGNTAALNHSIPETTGDSPRLRHRLGTGIMNGIIRNENYKFTQRTIMVYSLYNILENNNNIKVFRLTIYNYV